MERRRILVIAASDSSGGAGLEADQRVIARHECYATTATTALTAQNTSGVHGIHHIPPDFVVRQIDAVCEDIGVDIVKIGVLASSATAHAVAQSLIRHGSPPVILDPVMISTSGSQLFPDDAVITLIDELFPITTILTPNLPEAQLLLSKARRTAPGDENERMRAEIASVHDLVDLAARIQRLGPRLVLLKGGHLPLTSKGTVASQSDDTSRIFVVNVLHDGNAPLLFVSDHIKSKNTHGTGCSLASALASQIVLQRPERPCLSSQTRSADTRPAVQAACEYIEAGIRLGVSGTLGKGSGPINHYPPNVKTNSTVRVVEYGGRGKDVAW